VSWHVAMMPSKRRLLDTERLSDQLAEQLEQVKARIRAKVEHSFRVIKPAPVTVAVSAGINRKF